MNALPASVLAESGKRTAAAITRLLRTHPFFGSLALRLRWEETRSVETIATDGAKFYFNPDWVACTDSWQLDTAVARCVYACSLKHHTRRSGRDPELWQLASQLVTHEMLRECGFRLPPKAECLPDHSVEQAYQALVDQLPPPEEEPETPAEEDTGNTDDDQQDPGGDADCSDSDGDPDSTDQSQPENNAGADNADDSGDSDDDTVDPTNHSGAGDDDSDASTAKDASPPGNDPSGGNPPAGTDTAKDNAQPGSPNTPAPDPSGTGVILDAPPEPGNDPDPANDQNVQPTPESLRKQEQEWDKATHQAAAFSRTQGQLHDAIRETIDSMHDRRLDWRALLREYATDHNDDDFTWSLPSRRFIDEDLYLPAAVSEESIESLCVIIDTSESISSEKLSRIWSELHAFAGEMQPEEIHLLQVDDELQYAKTFHHLELPAEIEIVGRGWTDFRPGFAWLADRSITPTLVIYLTDLICNDYPAEPQYPVLWLNWTPPLQPWRKPPFGQVIDVPD